DLELSVVADALGDDLEPEGAGHRDDRLDDRDAALVAAVQALDERAVDLEPGELEAIEVGEGGVAGAEVVQEDAHAARRELLERVGHRLRAFEQHALGDLELK